MQIFGPATVQNARAIAESMKASAAQPTIHSVQVDTVDQLDISREAQYLMHVQGAPEIRAERVAEIRSQIQAGRYESTEKLHAAVDRLLDELA